MRILKYLGIWLVTVLAAVLLANFAGSIAVNHLFGDQLMPTTDGYAKKMQFPLKAPADEKEEKDNGFVIMLRTLIADESGGLTPGLLYHFLFMNTSCDQSIVFLNAQGQHDFSFGTFANAYLDMGEPTRDYLLHPVGLICIREWSQQAGCRAVYDVLAQVPDAVMRLDAYTVRDYKVQPVQLTLLDSSGKELLTQEFDAEGDVIRADNCYIKNEANTHDDGVENSGGYSVYDKLTLTYGGEREIDRIAEELAKTVPLGQDGFLEEQTHRGFLKLTRTRAVTEEGCTGITVMQFGYWRNVVFYTVLLGAISAVILLIVFIRRR